MSKPGWITKHVWVAECGNCGDWSHPYFANSSAEQAEGFREVDGVAMCEMCADAVEGES